MGTFYYDYFCIRHTKKTPRPVTLRPLIIMYLLSLIFIIITTTTPTDSIKCYICGSLAVGLFSAFPIENKCPQTSAELDRLFECDTNALCAVEIQEKVVKERVCYKKDECNKVTGRKICSNTTNNQSIFCCCQSDGCNGDWTKLLNPTTTPSYTTHVTNHTTTTNLIHNSTKSKKNIKVILLITLIYSTFFN